MEAVALALELDDVDAGEEAIEDRGRRGDIAEELAPVFGGPIGCDHDRSALVATDDDFEDLFRGVGSELLHAEIFEDEQVDLGQCLHERLALGGGLRLGKVLNEIEDAASHGAEAGTDGADGESRGEVALADAGWAEEEDMGVLAVPSSTSLALGILGLNFQSKSDRVLT